MASPYPFGSIAIECGRAFVIRACKELAEVGLGTRLRNSTSSTLLSGMKPCLERDSCTSRATKAGHGNSVPTRLLFPSYREPCAFVGSPFPGADGSLTIDPSIPRCSPYFCICGLSYSNAETLTRHITDTNKYYKCHVCHNIITRKDNMERHYRNQHPGVIAQPEVCKVNPPTYGGNQ